jgi:4-hydroxy-tetrahydrodipicolinate synthase
MYAMADLLGLARIEPPRPILPLSPEARSRVREALQHLRSAGSFIP